MFHVKEEPRANSVHALINMSYLLFAQFMNMLHFQFELMFNIDKEKLLDVKAPQEAKVEHKWGNVTENCRRRIQVCVRDMNNMLTGLHCSQHNLPHPGQINQYSGT